MQENANLSEIEGKCINVSECGENFINLVEIGGVCNVHD